MLTSDNRDFLSEIAKRFISFRKVIGEEADDETSCLCSGCLKMCQSLTEKKCVNSYDKFLCYTEDDKCKTEASRNFCHKCNVSEEKMKKQFSMFQYQLFLEEYMKELNKIHPKEAKSRGLLIFHGLGSGKTCSGLLVGEACRGYKNKNRKMILMIPASLVLEPWIKELSGRCSKNGKLRKKLRKAIKKNSDKPEAEQKKIYKEICKEEGYYIIHYNAENISGGWRDSLKEIPTREKSTNPFDDSVIVIDEVHNFINSIVNSEIGTNNKSKRDIYNQIYFARNAKVILLTGTPIYNKPVELAYMFNLLRGYISDRKNIVFTTDEKEFNKLFLKSYKDSYVANNPNMFRRRINGLISYYKGANEGQFAKQVVDKVYVPFSEEQQDAYFKIQEVERQIMKESEVVNESARIKQNTAMVSNVCLPKFIFDIGLQKNYGGRKGNHIKKNGEIITPRIIKSRRLKNKILPTLVKKEDYNNVLELLDNDEKPLHIDNDLHKISRKMYHALKLINKSTGPILFYSQYEGIYGISMFAEVLKQNGYVNFDKLEGGVDEVYRRRNLPEDDPNKIVGTYMLWTGNHASNATRKIYNSFNNKDGSIIKCFLMTKAGKEGINLLAVRQIHILEPWWNNVIDEQVIGRGIRMCSHNHIRKNEFEDLRIEQDNKLVDERIVNIYKYYGLPDLRPMEYIKSGKITEGLINSIKKAQLDMKRKSTDFYIHRIADRKKQKEDVFKKLMKDVAIDCFINELINNRQTGQGCFVDDNHPDYFNSWDIEDNSLIIEGDKRKTFELITVNGKKYWKDDHNNVYERHKDEGMILKPINVEYVSIGKYRKRKNKIKFNVNVEEIDSDKVETKIERDLTDYISKNMGYDLLNKKVLFISNRVNILYEFLSVGANVDIYDNYVDNIGKLIKKDMEDISLKNKKFVKSKSGKYDLIYTDSVEDQNLESDFIIIPNTLSTNKTNLIYKLRDIKGKHYLLNKNEYKTELIGDIIKFYKNTDIIKDLTVSTYSEFEGLIKSEGVPLSLSKFKNNYVFRNLKKFLEPEVLEIYNNKKFKHENKVILVDNNLFTLEKLNKNMHLLGKTKIITLKTEKELRKEKKKLKKIKNIISASVIETKITEMMEEKKRTSILLTSKAMMKEDKPEKKVKKKKSKIGGPCEKDLECFSKKCEDNTCVSNTKKKPKKSKAKTEKKAKKSKPKTEKKAKKSKPKTEKKAKKSKKSKIGGPCEKDLECFSKKCEDNKCVSKTKKKSKIKPKTDKKSKKKSKMDKKSKLDKKSKTDNKMKEVGSQIRKLLGKNKERLLKGELKTGDIKKVLYKKYGKEFYKTNKTEIKQIIQQEVDKIV